MATKARKHEEDALGQGMRTRNDNRTGIAIALWCVLAFLVWNVVFDLVLVLAGRRFVHAAAVAARQDGPYLQINDWMHAATTNGLRVASLSAAAVLGLSLAAIVLTRRGAKSRAGQP